MTIPITNSTVETKLRIPGLIDALTNFKIALTVNKIPAIHTDQNAQKPAMRFQSVLDFLLAINITSLSS